MKKSTWFPSTFEIAIILTLVVSLATWGLTRPEEISFFSYGVEVVGFWKKGFWSLLEFTLQMILILVLGHALAISAPVNRWLSYLANSIKNNSQAVMTTGLAAMIGGYLNWGFGLILGAVLARKIAESANLKGIDINYPLVGASGYLGMMVWHGGLSGSAPLKVAEQGHFLADAAGTIPLNETVFSLLNVQINLVLILAIIVLLYLLSKRKFKPYPLPEAPVQVTSPFRGKTRFGIYLGLFLLILAFADLFTAPELWSVVDLNFVNFLLLGSGLLAYQNLAAYLKGVSNALSGSADILIQFPFYAGIMGMIRYSGLLDNFTQYLSAYSSSTSFPLLTFLSAAFINCFVPSGGGQWAIQGPVIMDTSLELGLIKGKMILAFAYGDQLTNMLQPFWALPLLAITGLSAKVLLRYTFYFFLVGLLVFGLGIYLST
jgi:short-chain fatty acids transporter